MIHSHFTGSSLQPRESTCLDLLHSPRSGPSLGNSGERVRVRCVRQAAPRHTPSRAHQGFSPWPRMLDAEAGVQTHHCKPTG